MEEQLVSPAVPPSERVDTIGQAAHGMKVFDAAGKLVGHVDATYGGLQGESARPTVAVIAAPALAPVTGQQPVPIVETVSASANVPVIDQAFGYADEDMPRELRSRLQHDGFIRIDAGFFRHHRYALRDQIERINDGSVVLNVAADELIKH